MTHILFSIIFLMASYFLAVLALVQGYIPGGYRIEKGDDGKTREFLQYLKILGISFIIASALSGMMFYFFIYPSYQY
ncbi:hypothetical protein [Aquiflexum gelatinilyticum]|uniref:hypothetical protein n=1 Tax=Aquiflexum gelatinilyticum TaxID=2961943 RepID=UPI0021687D2F|nr:hypothetical protein [Aquiflexum gelatinilyticum]MCS4434522.1 hypothetical protein [Aquiflexum gelatinilyticum]